MREAVRCERYRTGLGYLRSPRREREPVRLGYSGFGTGSTPGLVERPPDSETCDDGPTRPRPLARGRREVAIHAARPSRELNRKYGP